MYFNKYELHTLKYLSSYKIFSISIMAVAFYLFLFGICVTLFKKQTGGELFLNKALTAASIVQLGCSYFMFHYIKIIEKFKKGYKLEKSLQPVIQNEI